MNLSSLVLKIILICLFSIYLYPQQNQQTPASDSEISPVQNEINQISQAQLNNNLNKLSNEEKKAKNILDKGIFYALAAFFIFGLALNLTPCVYPVIPITISFFTQQGKNKDGDFILALSYVMGIAIVFAILGLVSSIAGKQWGFLFQSPWFVIAISLIMLCMAVNMFGVFEITIPTFLMNASNKSRQGLLGAFVMGLTVGFIIAPCAAGIIIGLVGIVAKYGLVWKGTLLFFSMGLGLGLPYLVLGTFASRFSNIPQSGMWMVWIKKFFGMVLIGIAFYFILPQLKSVPNQQGFIFGILTIFSGIFLGFLDNNQGYGVLFKKFKIFIGIILTVLGIYWVIQSQKIVKYQISWAHYKGETIEELTSMGKPVFLDFYADWCAPCKQMDKTTFLDRDVIGKFDKWLAVKVDCTKPDEKTTKIMERFQISGMPTYIFINKSGQIRNNLTTIGFMNSQELINYLMLTSK